MEFIFGIAIGFTVGFLVKHCIEVWNEPMEPHLGGYNAEEGYYDEDHANTE